MQITGSTGVFLILGVPVAQVRAPAMLERLFLGGAVPAAV